MVKLEVQVAQAALDEIEELVAGDPATYQHVSDFMRQAVGREMERARKNRPQEVPTPEVGKMPKGGRWDGLDCAKYCTPSFPHPSCPGPCAVAKQSGVPKVRHD